jgi:NAD+-dependent secondary alcohol dehydrogenase Adh1
MKAARLHAYSEPLRLESVPVPEITERDDLIVRVAGAGLCRTDIHLIDGALDGAVPDNRPVTLGHENSGWVEATGSADSGLEPGTAVLLHPIRSCGTCAACRRGADMFCEAAAFTGLWADGGFAEFVKTSVRAAVPLPPGMDPIDIAPYADAGLTAMRAVSKAALLLAPGDLAVVVGAGGGLGHIALQLLAVMTPATIVAVDVNPEALRLSADLGAHHAFAPAEAPDGVGALSEGRGARVVLDFVGEHGTPSLAVSMLGQGGCYLVVGYGESLELSTAEIVVKELRIEGTLVGTHDELRSLVGMVHCGQVRLHTVRYDLDRVNDALDDLRANRVRGRAVIVPSDAEGSAR